MPILNIPNSDNINNRNQDDWLHKHIMNLMDRINVLESKVKALERKSLKRK